MDPQTMDPEALNAFGAGVVLVSLLISLIFYVFISFSLMKIANRTGTENAWFAWLPILNVVLVFNIAGKPLWWLAALIGGYILAFLISFVMPILGIILIPLVGIGALVITVIVWMAVAEEVGKPGWWGIIAILVPPVGIGYLAFAD